jgi:hypothetical protein
MSPPLEKPAPRLQSPREEIANSLSAGVGLAAALATAPVLAVRLALWGGERTLTQALLEVAVWLGGLALATHRLEARLIAELRGYLGAPA